MGFLDTKEDLLKIILTQHGRKRLSEGNLRVAHYAFLDDEIDYEVSSGVVTGSILAGQIKLLDYSLGTFTRESEATYFHEDTLTVEYYASGVLRQPTQISELDAFMIENARTNYVPSSVYLDAGWAINNATITLDQHTSPDGVDLAEGVSYDAATGAARIVELLPSLPTHVTASCSSFIRRTGTSWAQNGPILQFRDWTGSTVTVSPEAANDTAWERLLPSDFITSDTGASTPEIRVRNNQAEIRDCSVWGVQVEVGQFATTLIPTSGSISTRQGDELDFASGEWEVLRLADRFVIYVSPEFSDSDFARHATNSYVFYRSASDYLMLDDTGRWRLNINGNLIVQTNNGAWNAGDVITLTGDFINGQLTVAGTGASDGVFSNTAGVWPDGTLEVGRRSGVNHYWFGLITEPYIPE